MQQNLILHLSYVKEQTAVNILLEHLFCQRKINASGELNLFGENYAISHTLSLKGI